MTNVSASCRRTILAVDLHGGNLLGRARDGDDVRDDVCLLLPADEGGAA